MGTRSTVKVFENEECLASLYIQYDGYPQGVGDTLVDFLKTKTIVNGFGNRNDETIANGAGCLAAQLIAHLKTGVGDVYMTTQDDTQEYNYEIHVQNPREPIRFVCEDEDHNVLFDNTLSNWDSSKVG